MTDWKRCLSPEHDAIVMQPTEVCCLPASTVQALSKENPDPRVELLKRWHRALSEADAWLTELSTGPARQRIARLLLRLVHDDANPECILFGREDLGDARHYHRDGQPHDRRIQTSAPADRVGQPPLSRRYPAPAELLTD